MTGLILAAGLGTRLRPWTLEHPKALVPVAGVPMLERVINLLKNQGCSRIVINAHHFAEQIIDYISRCDFGVDIIISDESQELLDTGGGILRACTMVNDAPVLVHNVDILSTADLRSLYKSNVTDDDDITLLVCDRDSSRKLLFDNDGYLCGWHNIRTDELKKINGQLPDNYVELSFSGIYVIGKNALIKLSDYSDMIGKKSFPIMDFLLSGYGNLKIKAQRDDELEVLDIGKPSTLEKADGFIKNFNLNL